MNRSKPIKLLALTLSLFLVITALPSQLGFLLGRSKAAAVVNEPMKIVDGKVTNKDAAYYHTDVNGLNIYYWITNRISEDHVGRAYDVSVFFDYDKSDKELSYAESESESFNLSGMKFNDAVFSKDESGIRLNGGITHDAFSDEEFCVSYTITPISEDINISGKGYSDITAVFDGKEENYSVELSSPLLIDAKTLPVIAGITDGKLALSKSSSTVQATLNNNTPGELKLYQTNLVSSDLSEFLNEINKSGTVEKAETLLKNNQWSFLENVTAQNKIMLIDVSGMAIKGDTTHLMFLYKDALSFVTAAAVEITLPTCSVTVKYTDITDPQNPKKLADDETIKLSGLSYALEPKQISGYMFAGTDKNFSPIQDMIDGGNVTVQLNYKQIVAAARVNMLSVAQIIRPTNPLDRYEGSTNMASFSFPSVSNSGNIDLTDAELVFTIPKKNDKNEAVSFEVSSFTTGKYQGASGSVMSVFYKTNKKAQWTAALQNNFINVNSSVQVSSLGLVADEYITAIKYVYPEMPQGFVADIAPEIKAALSYKGYTENFTVSGSAALTAKYDAGAGEQQTEQSFDVAPIQVYNPVYTLTVKYQDESGSAISYKPEYAPLGKWDSVTLKVQAYTHFGSYPHIQIPNYVDAATPTVHAVNAIQYDSSKCAGYMPESDVTITHNYVGEKPMVINPTVSSKYSSVYPGDKNAFYIDRIGTSYNAGTFEGNKPLSALDVAVTIPDGFNLKSVEHPAFNRSGIKFDFSYKTNLSDWKTIYDLNAYQVERTVFDLKENEAVTQIKYVYTVNGGNIAINTYNITRMILSGDVSKTSNGQNITLSADVIAKYKSVNLDSGNEDTKEIGKDAQQTISVKSLATISINNAGVARVQAGESFRYEMSNISNTGDTLLYNYTIKNELPAEVLTSGFYTGKYIGVADGKTNINVSYTNGTAETFIKDASKNELVALSNTDVKSIEICFSKVSMDFKAEEFPQINVRVKNGTASNTEIQNNISVEAKWISENDSENSDVLKETYNIKTKVVKPEIGIAVITAKPQVLSREPFSVTLDNIGNKGNTEIYDFTVNMDVPENLTVLSVNTGTWKMRDVWNGNTLSIQYRTAESGWVSYKNVIGFDSDAKIDFSDVSERILSVRLVFSVAPEGFENIIAPKMNFVAGAKLPDGYSFAFKASVTGKFGSQALPSFDSIPNTSQYPYVPQKTAACESKIIVPKMSEHTVSYPSEIRFDKPIEITVGNMENTGLTYLYDVWFTYEIPIEAEIKAIDTGAWIKSPDYKVFYQTVNGQNHSDWILLRDNLSENTHIDLSEITLEENERIIAVKFYFGEVQSGFKAETAPKLTVFVDSAVAPGYTLKSQVKFNALGGYSQNPLKPTEQELQVMDCDFSSVSVLTTLILKPLLQAPNIAVSKETVKYREKFDYIINGLSNAGNTALSEYYIENTLSERVRLLSIETPKFNNTGTFNVLYKTNTDSDESWTVWEKNLSRTESKLLYAPELKSNQYITKVALWLGDVGEGFGEVSEWKLNCINWSSAYETDGIDNLVALKGIYEDLNLSGSSTVIYRPDLPEIIKSNISKNNPDRIYPMQKIHFVYENIINKTEASIDSFSIIDEFGVYVQPVGVTSGTYTSGKNGGEMSVQYKTNKTDSWITIIKNQDVTKSATADFPKMNDGEYITEVRFYFGTVAPGFAAVEKLAIDAVVSTSLPNDKEIKSELKLDGFIDGSPFTESKEFESKADFGWVEIELINNKTKAKIGENYRYYGLTGEAYSVPDHPVIGYVYVSLEGNRTGVFKKGYTDTVKCFYNDLPKTGMDSISSIQLLIGGIVFATVSTFSLVKRKKRKTV